MVTNLKRSIIRPNSICHKMYYTYCTAKHCGNIEGAPKTSQTIISSKRSRNTWGHYTHHEWFLIVGPPFCHHEQGHVPPDCHHPFKLARRSRWLARLELEASWINEPMTVIIDQLLNHWWIHRQTTRGELVQSGPVSHSGDLRYGRGLWDRLTAPSRMTLKDWPLSLQ